MAIFTRWMIYRPNNPLHCTKVDLPFQNARVLRRHQKVLRIRWRHQKLAHFL